MRLTTKGRFAVTAMLDLALHEAEELAAQVTPIQQGVGSKPITLAGISERQHISLSYLEQLFSRLRKDGLVSSVRGPGGGYRLAKPASEISVSNIITAVDELIDATQCGGTENCHDEGRCMTHDLWTALNGKILEYLSGVSLAELVANQLNKQNNQPVQFTLKRENAQLRA
ncbi:MAG TPA: Fe-S cluster assembly transcription factor [Methylotenera sp.]|nr:Fe-S cluster assembly transcription factor [Methylotenera sp.]HPH09146.1 Fe-S cluster assembly transcription factor [Methylotenera sp.]HPM48390.1 Fe-S cluster assembly transcription factor [Methylotenera sp.]